MLMVSELAAARRMRRDSRNSHGRVEYDAPLVMTSAASARGGNPGGEATVSQGQNPERREAAARLRRLKEEILRQWVARVRDEVPAAEGQSRAVILDHIPHLLDQLAG